MAAIHRCPSPMRWLVGYVRVSLVAGQPADVEFEPIPDPVFGGF